MKFWGYVRNNGEAGVRNYVLIIPSARITNIAATRIANYVTGTKAIITTGEVCRHSKDRKRLADLYIGLAKNPNTYATIILGAREDFGYPEVLPSRLADEIRKSEKPVSVLTLEKSGGLEKLVVDGIKQARKYVHEASLVLREQVPLSKLQIGVKCGWSDATSGISGNPCFGKAADLLVKEGGTVIFSETLELIGAEEDVAKRCVNPKDAERLLEMVKEVEDTAKASGEDIRSINPIPSNIKAGISTLEEKSLGAAEKAGSMPIQSVLEYAQRPEKPGLHFMHGWASAFSLPVSLAAAGCQITLYQLGGGDLTFDDPPMLAHNVGIVAPLMFVTGNPRTAQRAAHSIDFSSGGIITGEKTLNEAGEELFKKIISIANGEVTKGETINYTDVIEPYFLGPVF
ncbi:MAG: UxaA family hydrolase [Acetivibrionales bacterium]